EDDAEFIASAILDVSTFLSEGNDDALTIVLGEGAIFIDHSRADGTIVVRVRHCAHANRANAREWQFNLSEAEVIGAWQRANSAFVRALLGSDFSNGGS